MEELHIPVAWKRYSERMGIVVRPEVVQSLVTESQVS